MMKGSVQRSDLPAPLRGEKERIGQLSVPSRMVTGVSISDPVSVWWVIDKSSRSPVAHDAMKLPMLSRR